MRRIGFVTTQQEEEAQDRPFGPGYLETLSVWPAPESLVPAGMWTDVGPAVSDSPLQILLGCGHAEYDGDALRCRLSRQFAANAFVDETLTVGKLGSVQLARHTYLTPGGQTWFDCDDLLRQAIPFYLDAGSRLVQLCKPAAMGLALSVKGLIGKSLILNPPSHRPLGNAVCFSCDEIEGSEVIPADSLLRTFDGLARAMLNITNQLLSVFQSCGSQNSRGAMSACVMLKAEEFRTLLKKSLGGQE